MAFLDFLTGKMKCPRCGTSGAKEEYGRILCPNPSCAYYAGASAGSGQPTAGFSSSSASEPAWKGAAPARTVTIRYQNYKGEVKTFSADADSGARRKKHISVCVAPKNVRIVLSRDRILNWNEVDGALAQRVAPGQNPPSPRERQVLAYHKKYKSTSPLYEEIRARYPHW
jgi:hypothetical protein